MSPDANSGMDGGMKGRATVILPCAGRGSRLGLPFPKELLPLGPGRTPLDATLELILPHADRLRLVVVTDTTTRQPTIAHILRAAKGRLPVAFVPQLSDLPETIGAVLSAQAWFSDRNLCLLPDQVLDTPRDGLIPDALALLDNAGFCFVASPETDPERLSRDGALRLNCATPPRVTGYAEHPCPADAAFNAVWFAFAFRAETAPEALPLMHRAVCGTAISDVDLAASPLYGCPALTVGPYHDTGTWPAVLELWRDQRPEHSQEQR